MELPAVERTEMETGDMNEADDMKEHGEMERNP